MDNNLKATNSRNTSHVKKQGAFAKIIVLLVILAIVIYAVWWFFTSSGSSALGFRNQIKQEEGRVNVLLLGNGGGTHDGASLTDSIIVASYDLKTHKAILFSIPRDLWLDNANAKVNTVYQQGKKETGNGLKYSEEKIGEIMGIPIHYGVRVDFNGFAKAIDLVDGIDVQVTRAFDDYNYPIDGKEDDLCGLTEKEVELTDDQFKALNLPPTASQPGSDGKKKYKLLVGANDKIATEAADFACRFEHIHYEVGPLHMNGEEALKFVRSRHGTNGEGSDFARSARQQLVLNAFRNKVLSSQTLFDPQKLLGLVSTFGESFETDIEKDKFLDFYNLSKQLDSTENYVLGDLGKGESILVVGSPATHGGAFVMVPKDEDQKIIAEFVDSKINPKPSPSPSLIPSASVSPAKKK